MSIEMLFDAFRRSLNQFFDKVDLSEVQKVVEKVKTCPGTLFLSGVGKSGFIAQKVAATLVSTGTRACFLSPAGALHGDIGIVREQDIFLAFSKSGESEEIIGLIPHLRKKGAFTIGVVSAPSSRLGGAADLAIHLPLQREVCPHDLAPTASTATQLIFGDCLAIALMQAKQFSVQDFASNHPAGFLGRKITLKTSDLMLKGEAVPLCKREDKLIDILHILTGKRCGCILVADADSRLEGIFTDGDLRRAIHSKGESALRMRMGELMTHTPRTVGPDEFAFAALRKMEEDPSRLITVLPVVQTGSVAGLIRLHDILQTGLK
jgi:arabinose-5-phosphate isomerase